MSRKISYDNLLERKCVYGAYARHKIISPADRGTRYRRHAAPPPPFLLRRSPWMAGPLPGPRTGRRRSIRSPLEKGGSMYRMIPLALPQNPRLTHNSLVHHQLDSKFLTIKDSNKSRNILETAISKSLRKVTP